MVHFAYFSCIPDFSFLGLKTEEYPLPPPPPSQTYKLTEDPRPNRVKIIFRCLKNISELRLYEQVLQNSRNLDHFGCLKRYQTL